MTELRRRAIAHAIRPVRGAAVASNLGAAARTALRGRALLAPAGRAVVVVLAVGMIVGSARPLDLHGLVAVAIAAAIWLLSLRTAAAGAPLALGPRVRRRSAR